MKISLFRQKCMTGKRRDCIHLKKCKKCYVDLPYSACCDYELKSYFYLNDVWDIYEKIDECDYRDLQRYSDGNYFKTYNAAYRFKIKIIKLRKGGTGK